MNADAVVREAYFDEAKKIGFEGGFVLQPVGPTFVHVADDPEKAWAEIGKYVLYEAQTYASFQTPGQHSTPGVHAASVDDLKASPQYVVGTPDEVFARLQEVPGQRRHRVQPARRRTPARDRVVEPRALRGEGVAAIAARTLRGNTPLGKGGFSAYRRRTAPPRRSVVARYRNFDSTLGAGTDTQAAESRAGRRAPAPGRTEGGAERARARARRARARTAPTGSRTYATRSTWCTRCGPATSSRPRRRARSSTSSSPSRRGSSTPTSRLRREHSEILATIVRAEKRPRRPRPERRRLRRLGRRDCASSSPRSSRPSPATANAAPTSSTRPTPSTSAAATKHLTRHAPVGLAGCVYG